MSAQKHLQTWALVLAALPLLVSCSMPSWLRRVPIIGSPRMCLELRASPQLNFFAEQPHVLRLWLFPLQSELGFGQADVSDLLAGRKPPGAAGDPIELRIAPGEHRSVDQPLPAGAQSIGLVADYYRGPGVQGGPRRLTVSGSCHVIDLSESELKLQ